MSVEGIEVWGGHKTREQGYEFNLCSYLFIAGISNFLIFTIYITHFYRKSTMEFQEKSAKITRQRKSAENKDIYF